MKKTKIIYDPSLTISENAANNNLSVSSIRRYIRLQGIDRAGDNEIIRQRRIREEIQKSSDISLAELSRRLGCSVNTIKKYINSSPNQSKNGSGNLSTIDKYKRKIGINVDSLWVIGARAKGGKRENTYHGNFIPQVPNNLIRRYTKKGEIVIDLFMGSGTTLFECEALKRHYIGYDINQAIIEHVQSKMDEGAPIQYAINKCDVTNTELFASMTELSLSKMGKRKADFLIVHPPYWDIIHFTDNAGDLSNITSLDDFLNMFTLSMSNVLPFLKADRHFAIVIGDVYRNSEVVPLGFYVMNEVMKNFKCKLKGIVIKDMAGNKAKIGIENLWRYKASKSDFFLFKHEYIFVFRKI